MKDIRTKYDIPYFKFEEEWSHMLSNTNKPNGVIEAICEIYDVSKVNKTEEQLIAMMGTVNLILTDTNTPKLRRIIELNGIEYGFLPDFYQMSFAELIDLDGEFAKGNLKTLFNILYRPVETKDGNYYTIKPYNAKYDNNIDLISIGDVQATLGFFQTSFQLLSPRFPISSLNQYKTKIMRSKKTKI